MMIVSAGETHAVAFALTRGGKMLLSLHRRHHSLISISPK
jgi:hypothetical protein